MGLPIRRIAIAATLVLSACGNENSHGISTDPNAAIGFITSNDFIPETADTVNEAGIPKDSDGRPYTFKYLGQKLPAFSGETFGGGVYSSESLQKWTVIDVWGIWCGDCIADAPYIAEVAARLAQDERFDFISIHTPPNAARADEAYGKFGSVEAYFNAKGYSYPTVLDSDASIRDALGISWTPSYLLVSPDGYVRGFRTDLSVSGENPVENFLSDIEGVRNTLSHIKAPTQTAKIGPSGANGLSGRTTFTFSAIQAAFPGYSVVTETRSSEGDDYPVFNVMSESNPNKPIFTIWPGWDHGHVGFVETSHPDVEGPNGTRIGKLFFGELPASEKENCFAGAEEYADDIICGVGEDRQFQYVFSPSAKDVGGPLAQATSDAKDRSVLTTFRYLPPS